MHDLLKSGGFNTSDFSPPLFTQKQVFGVPKSFRFCDNPTNSPFKCEGRKTTGFSQWIAPSGEFVFFPFINATLKYFQKTR